MDSKAVIYCRVSTREQGDSKLGLEAQETYCQSYCTGSLLDVVVVLTEVISATVPLEERPVFINAINVCRAYSAVLVVAKQDRLSRDELIWHSLNTGHTFGKKTTPKIVIAESPNASPFELSIRAAVSAEERRNISQRTKAALAEAKKRGTPLGQAGREAYVAKYGVPDELRKRIISMHNKHMTYAYIAKQLNAEGITKTSGKPWDKDAVAYVIRASRKNPSSAIPN